MAVKNRLDAVVKFRAREEEGASLVLAQANGRVSQARAAVEAAKEKLTRGEFGAGSAADWELRDAGKDRDREELRKAEESVLTAEKGLELAKRAHLTAHQRTEVVRRVCDARKETARQEGERQEQRDTDEFVMLRHPGS